VSDEKPIKVILAKLGLDGHDRGIKVVARALQDAGMEVIYMGMRLTPDEVAERAASEAADVIGISLLSGAHQKLMRAMVEAAERQEIKQETLIVVGGTVPESEEAVLHEMGVDGVFPVGSSLADIEQFIREHRKPRG
jgi:methylmalonyl-CoA mutase C-terminal domain/subunit